jgi:Ribbon-helix-helix protein, copG family
MFSIRCMRTTLSIDDDVLRAVKERAKRQRRSIGEVLSDLARQALTGQYNTGPGATPEAFHDFEPFPHRGPAVSSGLIDQLREEELA